MGSYADSIREELLDITVKRPCCKKALVGGLLLTATSEGERSTASFRSGAIAELATREFRRQFGKPPTVEKRAAYGHTKWEISLPAAGVAKLLKEQESGLPDCEGCRSAFLRGAFLSCGTVNDPERSTHLEFLLQNGTCADRLRSFLQSIGYEPRTVKRQNGVGLYFKDAASVEDLIALSGAGKISMDMMNLRIEREIRNQENRATNCVAKNIEKSVSASAKQMDAIEKLTVTGMLAQLPDSIRLTARLRAENPNASLEELRNLHVPPITKSGLNHRLQKILNEADKLD